MADEKRIENMLVRAVQNRGGLAIKLTNTGIAGLPDRLVLIKGGHVAFVEVKAKGQKPRKLQLVRIRELRNLGFPVYVLDDETRIGGIIDEICTP